MKITLMLLEYKSNTNKKKYNNAIWNELFPSQKNLLLCIFYTRDIYFILIIFIALNNY